MVNKSSPHYLKSTYEDRFYGNDNSTTYERKLVVEGNDKDYVKTTAGDIQRRVMP